MEDYDNSMTLVLQRRAEISDVVDELLAHAHEALGHKPVIGEDGVTYISSDILIGLAAHMGVMSMQAQGEMGHGYADAGTIVQVLALRAEGKSALVDDEEFNQFNDNN